MNLQLMQFEVVAVAIGQVQVAPVSFSQCALLSTSLPSITLKPVPASATPSPLAHLFTATSTLTLSCCSPSQHGYQRPQFQVGGDLLTAENCAQRKCGGAGEQRGARTGNRDGGSLSHIVKVHLRCLQTKLAAPWHHQSFH